MDAIYNAARERLIQNMTAEALASLSTDQRVALTAAVPGRMPDQLLDYWTRGEGAAKIRWGTDGSFDRCVRHLRKYFKRDPKGLCAKLHKRATGEWPAEKGIQSDAGWGAPSETEYHLTHNQKSHGNRVGKPGNVASKTGLGAKIAKGGGSDAPSSSPSAPSSARKLPEAQHAALESVAARAAELAGSNRPTTTKDTGVKDATASALVRQGYLEDRRQASGARALMLTDKGHDYLARVRDDKEHADLNAKIKDVGDRADEAEAQSKDQSRGSELRRLDGQVARQLLAEWRKLREQRDRLAGRARTADAGGDQDMSGGELTAHAGPETAEDIDSMDAALAYLDEPDTYAESLMPMVTHWSGMLAPIGKPTGDRRIFEQGALSNRDLPLPLMWQELSDDGHRRSSVVGTIEEVEHREDGTYGAGRFLDPELFPDVDKARALLKARVNGPSVDLDDVTYSLKNADGTPFDPAAFEADMLAGGDPAKPLLSISDGRISGATLVSIPAFAEVAHTWTLEDRPDEELISAALGECEDCGDMALAASAGYVDPPLAAFLPRDFSGPTPLTVTEDGLVFGHLATWSTCHVGFPGTCVTPPNSKSNYAYFHTSEVRTAEGERIPVGPLVLGAPHADLAKGFRAAALHYDQTGKVAALVRVYEDAHGIAFSGILVRELDAEQRAQFATLPLSGDWRRVGGNLELIAAISVPVPGFPVARSSGQDPAALVAAGMLHSPDAQAVDEPKPQPLLAEVASTTINPDGSFSVTFRGLEAVALKLLGMPAEREEQAAEVAGPDAQFDLDAEYEAAMELLDATLDRERMALLDITSGE